MGNYPNSYKGPVQVVETQPQLVGNANGLGDGTNAPALVQVRNPGGPNRFKLSIVFIPAAGVVVPAGGIGASNLWVHADDDMDNAGGSSGPYPVNDLEGTKAAPITFPTSAGLMGYSREFVTSADYITATMQLFDTPNAVPGHWYAKAEMYPAFSYFSNPEAWNTLRANFQLQVLIRAQV